MVLIESLPVPIVNYVDIPHILNCYLVRFLFKYIYSDSLKLQVRLILPHNILRVNLHFLGI